MLTHPNIDPIAVSIGPIDIHWYGLMYFVGFTLAYLIGAKRTQQPWAPVNKEQMLDLITWCALALILGARFGYALFYQFDRVLEDPLWLFKVWQGGMSFHGGLIGVMIAIWWFGKKKAQPARSFFEMGDFVVVLAPLGIGGVRLANFVNQELWGRPTEVAWGMVFPKAGDGLARHASQVYEACLEGFLLFIILFLFTRKRRPIGAASGVFLLGYGLARFSVEFFP